MEESFWHNRWQNNEIGFHEDKPNDHLVEHLPKFNLNPGSNVFVPLCGKTLDIHWLLSNGFTVTGVELSELAIKQLFESLNITPTIESSDPLKVYTGENIKIYVGDFFQLTETHLTDISFIYDRAALVALPESMRISYAKKLNSLLPDASQLVVVFEYDQMEFEGPPFSISQEMIFKYYGDFTINQLTHSEVKDTVIGDTLVHEAVWQLLPQKESKTK